jgi:hypothetical protein
MGRDPHHLRRDDVARSDLIVQLEEASAKSRRTSRTIRLTIGAATPLRSQFTVSWDRYAPLVGWKRVKPAPALERH